MLKIFDMSVVNVCLFIKEISDQPMLYCSTIQSEYVTLCENVTLTSELEYLYDILGWDKCVCIYCMVLSVLFVILPIVLCLSLFLYTNKLYDQK